MDGATLQLDDGPALIGIGELRAGEPARATIAPDAVSLHRTPPGGSPRNSFEARVVSLDSRGPVVGVSVAIAGQTVRADLTAAAVTELGIVPGATVFAVVKATQVTLHRM
ncbi:MAG: TOBE domain-containing protein [Propionibacteriaceae bacterium]|nr:TOBE domain-containing protein [Propionibacteriaceae bacterium]